MVALLRYTVPFLRPNASIRFPWPSADSPTYGDCPEQVCPNG
eukprot:gene291-3163_t